MQWRTVHGEQIPTIGLGTYELDGGECANTVRDALEIGYRHIDTAEHYDNQSEIGNAIANSSVDREELFLTTKVWKTNLEYEDVIRSTRASLEALDVDYVDLLLIHWPNERIPIEETLAAMNSLQDEGAVRHVGVSNFSIAQLRKAIATSETPILTNQVQYNPFTDRTDILEFCVKHDVLMTAYSPLAKGRVTKTMFSRRSVTDTKNPRRKLHYGGSFNKSR